MYQPQFMDKRMSLVKQSTAPCYQVKESEKDIVDFLRHHNYFPKRANFVVFV